MIDEIEAAGGRIVGREITIDAGGVRVRADVFYEDATGNRMFGEAKFGPSAGYTPNQIVGYPALSSAGGVPMGGNAALAGLTPGVPIGPTPVVYFGY